MLHKKQIKNVIKAITPSVFQKISNRWWEIKEKKRTLSVLQKNKKLENNYKNKRCFIIGNGSSLNLMDLKLLKNDFVFTVNNFFHHKDLITIDPTFHVCIEPLSNMLKNGYDYTYSFYNKIEEAFKKTQASFFFNFDTKNFFKENRLFENSNVYYLSPSNNNLLTTEDFRSLYFDISIPISFMDGVIFAAIGCAAHMGFDPIYIIGCDFDHIVSKDEKHFYKDTKKSPLSKTTNLTRVLNLYHYLYKMDKIKKLFHEKNIRIFNAGIGGFTDTFERRDYESIFKNKGPIEAPEKSSKTSISL